MIFCFGRRRTFRRRDGLDCRRLHAFGRFSGWRFFRVVCAGGDAFFRIALRLALQQFQPLAGSLLLILQFPETAPHPGMRHGERHEEDHKKPENRSHIKIFHLQHNATV
tara:strand:+ start:144 stop:470 length:327 start_codon:yes stop_codon:yes gene_type:complete